MDLDPITKRELAQVVSIFKAPQEHIVDIDVLLETYEPLPKSNFTLVLAAQVIVSCRHYLQDTERKRAWRLQQLYRMTLSHFYELMHTRVRLGKANAKKFIFTATGVQLPMRFVLQKPPARRTGSAPPPSMAALPPGVHPDSSEAKAINIQLLREAKEKFGNKT